jgi:hypothetical protein
VKDVPIEILNEAVFVIIIVMRLVGRWGYVVEEVGFGQLIGSNLIVSLIILVDMVV